MKTKDVAAKYNLDLNEFAEFITQHELPFKMGLFSSSIEDSVVPEYVNLFKSCKKILAGTYDFSDEQKELFGLMVGVRLPELLKVSVNEFNSLYESDPDAAGVWLFENIPNLDGVISSTGFNLIRKTQKGSAGSALDSLKKAIDSEEERIKNTWLNMSDAFLRAYDKMKL